MESLAALGLAANIVQFVHFGATLLSETSERYHATTGALIGNEELGTLANNVRELSVGLGTSPTGLGSPHLESQLREMSKECAKVSQDLIAVLNNLRVKGQHRRWESLKQAAKSLRYERKIDNLKKKLDDLQNGLVLCLMVMMKDQHSKIHKALGKLSLQHEKMEISGADKLQKLREDLILMLHDAESNAPEGSAQISDYIKDGFSDLVDENKRAAATQSILKSLKYDQMTARQGSIEEAHKRTFDWIFQDAADGQRQTPSFLKWLSTGDGIYWIAGRAGSGKSTLMKYLFQHPDTKSNLEYWSNSKSLVIASHFFWVAGTKMQKSQEGLLCSLLHDIFTRCPKLIPGLAPSRWNLAHSETQIREPWTRTELLQAFERLKQDDIPAKFCFFVDGLDEYDGDHAEILKILEQFATSPDIKVCVSSRPWNVFEKALGANGDAKLHLEDLTRDDIRLYIQDNLEQDERFEALEEDEGTSKMVLIREIVDLAHGVFLWVVLVVRDLLRGLSNDDTVSLLKKRLYSLPPTLETYFKSMLDSIDTVYREQTAQIMFLALDPPYNLPLTLLMLSFLDQHGTSYAIESPFEERSYSQLSAICSRTRTRIKARCSDLLIVPQVEPSLSYYLRPEVCFLHRTVKDFLLTQNIQGYLLNQLCSPFDVNEYSCHSILAQMKMVDPSTENCVEYIQLMMLDLTNHVQLLYSSGHASVIPLLDEAERVVEHLCGRMSHSNLQHLSDYFHTRALESPGVWIFQCAVQLNLYEYVEKRLSEQPAMANGHGHFVPLEAVFVGLVDGRTPGKPPDLRMVQFLLNYGASPNQYIMSRNATFWSFFLDSLVKEDKTEQWKDSEDDWLKLTKLFLRAGADPLLVVDGIGDVWEYLQIFFSSQEVGTLRAVALAVEKGPTSKQPSTWIWTGLWCCTGQDRRKTRREVSEDTPLLS